MNMLNRSNMLLHKPMMVQNYINYTPVLIIDHNWAKCLHNQKNIRIFALRKVRNDINVIAIA